MMELTNTRDWIWIYFLATSGIALFRWRSACSENPLLASMLSFMLMLLVMWELSPEADHWIATFACTSYGIVAWLSVTNMCFLGLISPWKAISLIVENTFGVVPLVYIFLDWPFGASSDSIDMYRERLGASIPSLLMVKSMARTVVDMKIEQDPSSWNPYVDSLEIFAWVAHGFYASADFGSVWFVVFVGIPVGISSLWLDRLVLQILGLHRTNARLIRSAFAATIYVGGPHRLTVFQSGKDFDALVDGSAGGMLLKDLFTAKQKDLDRLCSPSPDRVVRRLRTAIVSITKSFQQDVELRLLSATEHEMRSSIGIMLGISIMGERLPYVESERCCTSILMEQHIDEIGHLTISKATKTEVEAIPEIVEVTSWDSVSVAGRSSGSRMRRRRASVDSDATTGSSLLSRSTQNVKLEMAPCEIPVSKQPTQSYQAPWKHSTQAETNYLKEATQSTLEEILRSFNHRHSYCCNWHESLDRLTGYLAEMRRWKTCSDTWPETAQEPVWQCRQCSALQFEDQDGCWLCVSPRVH